MLPRAQLRKAVPPSPGLSWDWELEGGWHVLRRLLKIEWLALETSGIHEL